MPLPPHRKNRPQKNFCETPKTALQTLTALGISQKRAEKALAVTGNADAYKAMQWLVAHVNDPKLDKELYSNREFTLVAVPVGAFGDKLLSYWNDSRDICQWNEAHNQLPHMTLVPFFKASPNLEPQITAAVKAVVKSLDTHYDKPIDLTLHQKDDFIGFHINSPGKEFFERITKEYVSALKTIELAQKDTDEVIQVPSLMACLPWCTPKSNPSGDGASGSIEVKDVDPSGHLHIKLAYKYKLGDSITLSSLLDRFESVVASVWELRLYSRDVGIDKYQMFKVFAKYRARAHDELNLNPGDHISAEWHSQMSGDDEGWVLGTSVTTGCSGYFPHNHVARASESETWSLHTWLEIVGPRKGNERVSKAEQIANPIRELKPSFDCCAQPLLDSSQKTIPWIQTIGKLVQPPNKRQKLLIMRHAERVDYTFQKWISQCFSNAYGYERLDLNMPQALPTRTDGQYYPWRFDTPITNMGYHQAFLTGQMLRQQGISLGYVYCSPAFRCIQTAHALLKGMQAPNTLQIKVEPALFEWWKHYTELPIFLTHSELVAAGYNIDVQYVPLMTLEKLNSKKGETFRAFYDRNHWVSEHATRRCDMNTLIVAHAANLETNSRIMIGGEPLEERGVAERMAKIPYASLLAIEKNDKGKWEVAKPFVLPLTHSRNFQFDSRIFELSRTTQPLQI